jgi:hypothetical protein
LAITDAKFDCIFEQAQTVLILDKQLDDAILAIEATAALRDRVGQWRDQVPFIISF